MRFRLHFLPSLSLATEVRVDQFTRTVYSVGGGFGRTGLRDERALRLVLEHG